jgi:beta-glucosidase
MLSCFSAAQDINLRGYILDQSSKPIENALVTFRQTWSVAYTDENGFFALTPVAVRGAKNSGNENRLLGAGLARNILKIELAGPAMVSVDVFSVLGRKLPFSFSQMMAQGRYSIPIPMRENNRRFSQAVYLVRLKAGSTELFLKSIYIDGKYNSCGAAIRMPFSRDIRAGFSGVPTDTLVAIKPGYITAYVPVESFSDSLPDIIIKTDGVEPMVDSLMALLDITDKIGQMVQGEADLGLHDNDVLRLKLGSVLTAGAVDSSRTPADWRESLDELFSQALATQKSIPLIFGTDAVHGHNQCSETVLFPHNIGMGCTRNPALVRQAARITALEMAISGANWTFAPCIAVPQDERWGRTYEGYGETPELVSTMSTAAVLGFQGDNFGLWPYAAACTKHFVGDGGTEYGSNTRESFVIDQGDTRCDVETLRRIHLPGYIAAIKAGAATIMCSFSSFNGMAMHEHKYLLTDLLKGELGFDGFIITDFDGVATIFYAADHKEQVMRAVNAGMDMFMSAGANTAEQVVNELTQLFEDGDIKESRINDAVRRILRVKLRMGLFENPYGKQVNTADLGSQKHRAVARECVRQSVVLLKNENNVLPLPAVGKKIAVTGSHADDLKQQCGGWSLGWNGFDEGVTTTGTTILGGIKSAMENESDILFYSEGETPPQDADIIVVITGEIPYAEFFGDVGGDNISNLNLPESGALAVDQAKDAGKPVVLIVVSGRPLILGETINRCDAIIAAWLPGTEGQGVADVLFGDYAPSGKLSQTWPQSESQMPINKGDEDYESDPPLFPYGFGLTY